jgi:hypothetical protein
MKVKTITGKDNNLFKREEGPTVRLINKNILVVVLCIFHSVGEIHVWFEHLAIFQKNPHSNYTWRKFMLSGGEESTPTKSKIHYK